MNIQTYDTKIEEPNKHLLRTIEEQTNILLLQHLRMLQHLNQ